MATLGLIGSGNIGNTLAHLAVDAGLDVVLSNSRGLDRRRSRSPPTGHRSTRG
jgi:predicted dinucleotide-binding enzyme